MVNWKSHYMPDYTESGCIMAEFFVAMLGGIWLLVAITALAGGLVRHHDS